MPEAHAQRRDRLRSRLAAAGADAALITNLVNVRYLTGFTGSHAALLVRAADSGDDAVLCTDGRYTTQATEEAPDVELLTERGCAQALTKRVTAAGAVRLAIEEQNVTVELYRALGEIAREATPGAELIALGRGVEDLRRIKDTEEIAALRIASEIGDRALGEMIESILVGRTERHIAMELERRMADHGADAVAFPTIVATGPNSAVPHHDPGDRRVEDGDFLKIDFGARYHGYHADMTRTFVIGTEPAAWQQEIYGVVFAAQKAGREALAPGVEAAAVDKAARDVIEQAGYLEFFTHGLGHGVGLEIHEDPRLGPTATGKLDACMPVTVEPGIYLPGRGGVRIEDTLVVRPLEDGGPELLTITTKELLVL
ncbi:aminopeptidase P family protein [Streptomyces sp. SID3343]|uniref:aminopeptidase P family protein n=1 Tax=Streptomyces sp. SID3343 TaxID=2690260 RepID=UPI00136A1E5A|nr:aminopeptidase P family protein [Streptomyces sp. SID3343]MYV98908.1 M24 family metallopeptidase [Streptomyces sp. SID3343]